MGPAFGGSFWTKLEVGSCPPLRPVSGLRGGPHLAAAGGQGRSQDQADLVAHSPRGMFVHELLVPGRWPLQLLPGAG